MALRRDKITVLQVREALLTLYTPNVKPSVKRNANETLFGYVQKKLGFTKFNFTEDDIQDFSLYILDTLRMRRERHPDEPFENSVAQTITRFNFSLGQLRWMKEMTRRGLPGWEHRFHPSNVDYTTASFLEQLWVNNRTLDPEYYLKAFVEQKAQKAMGGRVTTKPSLTPFKKRLSAFIFNKAMVLGAFQEFLDDTEGQTGIPLSVFL